MASEGEPVGLFVVCDGIGGHLGAIVPVCGRWKRSTRAERYFSPFDPRGTQELSRSELDAALRGSASKRSSRARKLERQVRRAVDSANLLFMNMLCRDQRKPVMPVQP